MEVLGDARFRAALGTVGGVDEMVTEFIRIPDPPAGHPYTRRAMRSLLGRKYPPRGRPALRTPDGGVRGAGDGGSAAAAAAAAAAAGGGAWGGAPPAAAAGGGAAPGHAPLAPQLMGGDPTALALAVEVLVEEHGAHRVDLNAGCPSKRVTARGAGSSLLATPAALAEALAGMVGADASAPAWAPARGGAVPVTVKLRSGYGCCSDFDAIIAAVTGAGVAGLALHPRTKVQGYGGAADWALIGRARARTPLPVVGNGDVRTGADAAALVAATGGLPDVTVQQLTARPWFPLPPLSLSYGISFCCVWRRLPPGCLPPFRFAPRRTGYRFTAPPFTPATRTALLRSAAPSAAAYLDAVLAAARPAYDADGRWAGGPPVATPTAAAALGGGGAAARAPPPPAGTSSGAGALAAAAAAAAAAA
ncbi:hypothetical protein BU14_0025s0022 [Porphyra umbilicalis]|uniref:tRNA-dihydrouridine(47) synthase [NAD(P)(+)] n=1 Tax=Porphyra umbilicalis TaxID=2786 RepID=A0A1X6PJZ9_PORUM|nr:hypothetical protein BU14_0025s0022 [Porphyra umbilicalis]|eukprot:OSX81140.1 hypothetical protein BU14_0025s0022 [Porphyra umbilicalis]